MHEGAQIWKNLTVQIYASFLNDDYPVHVMDKTINLIILEAYPRDVGRAVARIDHKSMEALCASTGDILEITGKKRSVSRCLPLYPTDEGKKIIRVDGLGRNNAGSAIEDTVAVKKIKTMTAEKITVKPLDSIPPIDERYLADALDMVPVTKNDNIMVPYFGGRLAFQIVDVIPDTDVIINQKTIFTITTQTQGLVGVRDSFVYPGGKSNPETLEKLKEIVQRCEKELWAKQDEIKHITRSMLEENHTEKDVREFLNSNSNEGLISTFEQLLNAYRQYVAELEATTRK